jgi:predicted nucleic acid-binding protein
MKRIVADSSALILLSKCNLLEVVCRLFEVVVPSSVIEETASAKLVDHYPDAAFIKEIISKGLIKMENPGKAQFQIPLSLHRGEKDALLLALNSRDSIFATDDGKAIKAARFLNIPFIISPKIVVDLFRLQKISLNEARQSIEKLGKIGRYSPEIIAESMLSLMETKNGKADNNTDT